MKSRDNKSKLELALNENTVDQLKESYIRNMTLSEKEELKESYIQKMTLSEEVDKDLLKKITRK